MVLLLLLYKVLVKRAGWRSRERGLLADPGVNFTWNLNFAVPTLLLLLACNCCCCCRGGLVLMVCLSFFRCWIKQMEGRRKEGVSKVVTHVPLSSSSLDWAGVSRAREVPE